MSDKLFFGEIEKQSAAAKAKYMTSRGKHGGSTDNKAKGDEDLKEYNATQSEEE